jgi:sugar phosphate isomerase/epimerase
LSGYQPSVCISINLIAKERPSRQAMPPMIYVSTGGFRGKTAAETSRQLLEEGINCIELSAGTYSEALLKDLKDLAQDVRFQVHNYFPPPAEPFVLNLGSLDPVTGNRSMAHVRQALGWCQILGGDHYSFHAGFLLDPKVDELGRRIVSRDLFDRDACIETFIERVTQLAGIAQEAGITLMVENNVLSAKNVHEFATNPLLMCDPDECRKIMAMMPDNVGMLVDVAHLKVSARSLGFDPSGMFSQCLDRIAGYHLSDNDGLEDSNQPFADDAWFWPYLEPDVGYYTVEVYGQSPAQLLQQVNLVKSKLSAANDRI